MLDTWIIAVCIAGGCVLLAVFGLTIYKCCQRRKRKYNKRGTKGQNGHVWQAHSNEVELEDPEDPQAKSLKEDGLCKDTIAGSTFPRRIKAEDQNPKPRKKDGLCQHTEKRYTYPRRLKPEQDLLLPINLKNPSPFETALQSAFPVGVSVVTSFQRSNVENNVNDERLKSSNGVQHSAPKTKAQETACSDSEDTSVYRNRSKNVLKNSVKKGREAKMKRAKSFNMGLEDLPEYGKPIKRSASTPSIIARKKVVRNDQRFENLETWSTAPLPETGYPLPLDESSNTLPSKYDDQDHVPPSYATSDSGVECLDAFSGHDDESLNNYDGVLESPGIPSSQLTPRDLNLFSSYKEHTSYNVSNETKHNDFNSIKNTNGYGFQSNLLAMASKDYKAFINANVVKDSISPSAVGEQDRFFQSTSKDNSTVINLPYNDPKMALRDTNNAEWKSSGSGSKNPNNSIKATERIQTTEQEMDFRSVKLRPTAKNYEGSNATNIYGAVKQEDTVATPLYQKENTQLTPVIQQNQQYIKTEIEDPSSNPTNPSITSGAGPNDTYFLGFSKKPTVDKENNQVRNCSPETEKRTDFHRIKLRQIPQSLKEHIAFREEMEPNLSVTQITPKHKDNVNSNTTSEENETTVSILDGIRKFQTQSVPGPKLSYGSHYISKKDPVSKHVITDSNEAVTNLKPVNIVTPEPLTIDIGIRKTTSTSTKPKAVNVVRKDPLMAHTNVTRPASVMESVPSEGKRHFRYSTEKLNQNHATKEINASQTTDVLIREQDRQVKTNTVTSKHDLVEKPVAVVTPQSPLIKRESPEERAALEEERKRNWKREQIEQKLSTAHIKSQNEQIFQASGLAYKLCMPELFSKIKQIGEEKEQSTTNN